jgi:hypothetical protein
MQPGPFPHHGRDGIEGNVVTGPLAFNPGHPASNISCKE